MLTSVDIDRSLVEKALNASGLNTKKAVIEAGLKELIASKNTNDFVDSFGAIKDFSISTNDIRAWREQEESIIEPGSVSEPSIS